MVPTKSKAKKTRETAIIATLAKRTRNAGSKKQSSANSGQGQHLRAEEVIVPIPDNIRQKLGALMRMMADLSSQMTDFSSHVEATEDRQKEVEASTAQPEHLSACQKEGQPQGGHPTLTSTLPRKCTDLWPNG